MRGWWSSLQGVEDVLAKICLLLSALIVFAGGVGRFVGHPLDWSMDFATFCFAWATFLGADLAFKENRHVAVEILLGRLPEAYQRYVRTLIWGLIVLFLCVLIVYSALAAYQVRFRSFQGIQGFSYSWVMLSVAVGSLLMMLTALRRLREAGRGE
ncbi:TRAP transporter small permease [Thermus antranikianii]|uniref:TRAP transporter small permease subunit n=1 Tax=Thermus antranikianii TaxID=88190 RepID=A0ABY7RRM0_9DEIN|nr:TRAP transporter small permease [Thermus antranikianii]WCM40342.1 TRAP transporter small permease subunit [Thermus antranikianii]